MAIIGLQIMVNSAIIRIYIKTIIFTKKLETSINVTVNIIAQMYKRVERS